MTSLVIVGYPDRLRADHAVLVEAAQARGLDVDVVSPSELSLATDGEHCWVSVAGQKTRPDVVLPRGVNRPWSFLVPVFEQWIADGARIVPNLRAASLCADKVTTSVTLANAGVPAMPTVAVVPGDGVDLTLFEAMFSSQPVVVKPARASKGRGVTRHRSWRDAQEALSSTVPLIGGMVDHHVVQPLATGAGCDYRVVVADRGRGHDVVALTRRTAPSEHFVTNVQGSTVEELDLKSADASRIAESALRAAHAMDLCFAGVDVIEHCGEMVVLEVNAWPGLAPEQRGTALADALLDVAFHG